MHTTIRTALPEDMKRVFELICELAVYERATGEVENSEEQLIRDGFGPEKIFDCIVAEINGKVEGFALFYTKYSTWKGRCLFLEDFLVSESLRQKGIGTLLFDEVVRIARNRHVKRMEWQVLEWNEPAIRFYKKYETSLDAEWLNAKLTYDQLQNFPV